MAQDINALGPLILICVPAVSIMRNGYMIRNINFLSEASITSY
jgi:hypothetical protein